MSNEEFERLWAKGASAPRIVEVPVKKKIDAGLSLGALVERIQALAEEAAKRGRLKRPEYEEMAAHTETLKKVIQKVDPNNALLATAIQDRARQRRAR